MLICSVSIPIFQRGRYESTVESLGNHEFDLQEEGAANFIRLVEPPVVTANIILDNVPELKNESNLLPSVIIHKNNIKIGIIGYLTNYTKDEAPLNKVDYEDEVISLKRETNKLKKEGVNILIALGHSGFNKDLEIACLVEDIDVVVGGHSHSFLWNGDTDEIPETPVADYPTMITQESGRKVAVVQAFAYTKYMGQLSIVFDSNYEISRISNSTKPILLNQNVPEDQDVLEIVRKYRKKIDNLGYVGTSKVILDAKDCRIMECNIGNFINDALLYYIKQNFSDVHISLLQGGRIRSSIVPHDKDHTGTFNMTKEDWINVLPINDTLSILTLKGSILKQALEHSINDWSTVNRQGKFLQLSGLKVIYDLSKTPGNRVVNAKAISGNNPDLELHDLNDNHEYTIITNSFLANTGNGYKMFESLPRTIIPIDELTAIFAYLKANSPINPVVSDRITILNKFSEERRLDERLAVTDDFCLRMKLNKKK